MRPLGLVSIARSRWVNKQQIVTVLDLATKPLVERHGLLVRVVRQQKTSDPFPFASEIAARISIVPMP